MLQSSIAKIFLLTIGGIVFFQSLHAQSGVIAGKVRDSSGGDPLVAATVQCAGEGTFTDYQGVFQIEVPVGTHSVTISYVGYEPKSLEVSVPVDTLKLEISLDPTLSMLREVTVTAGKFEQSLGETTASIEVLKPALLEQTNTTSIDEVLGKVPGVSIRSTSRVIPP